MNTPGNKHAQEALTDKIHKEEYDNSTIFDLRGQRLEDLGYTRVITIEPSSPIAVSEMEERQSAIIEILERYHREIAILTYGKVTEIYQRVPGSNLPTAQEDYDSPAGEDAVIAHAVACVRTGMKKKLN